jgi:tetratricopeptide (TPR) repeat protein
MAICSRRFQFAALAALALASGGLALAGDELCADLTNPFAAVPLVKETTGANWRHGFHRMRDTVTKYFEVYEEELEGYEGVSLEKVNADLSAYLDRKVQFDAFYCKMGQFFRPFVSPFHEDGFVNFGVWPYGADLWQKEARKDLFLLFYIDKRRDKLIQKLDHLPMFTPIHIWATMRSKSERMPWFEVFGFEIIPETVLTESTLRHLETGATQLRQKRYDLAVEKLEAAVSLQLPVFAESKTYSMLGRAYFEQRLFRGARNAYVNAVMRDRGVVANLVMLARTDLRIDPSDGNFAAEAKIAAEQALVIEPTNAEAHAELGLAIAMLGDIRGGYIQIDYAQKYAPRGQLPEANRNRAMIAILEKNLELAKQELNQAVILRATDYTLHLELGDVHMAMGHMEDARREYTQAKDLAPLRGEPFYKTALVDKLMADALMKDGKKDDATKLYNEALENVKNAIIKDVHMSKAYGLESEILRALGREEEAKKVLEKGATLNPKSSKMQDVYYEQAAAMGDWVGMEKATRASIAIRADAAHYSRLGSILLSKPEPDMAGAAAAYESSVAMDGSNAEDWATLGHIRVASLSDWEGGRIALEQAVRLQPANGSAWYDLGVARRMLLDRLGAVAAADTAVAILKSNDAKLLGAQTRVDRAVPPDLDEAADTAQAIANESKIDSDKARALSIKGGALLKQGKTDEALDALNAAAAILKDNPENELWEGLALIKKGDAAGAQEKLSSALDLTRNAPPSPLIAQVRADAEKALKDAAKMAPGENKPKGTETASFQQPDGQKKPTPPVSEENGNAEPVPAKAPGPR